MITTFTVNSQVRGKGCWLQRHRQVRKIRRNPHTGRSRRKQGGRVRRVRLQGASLDRVRRDRRRARREDGFHQALRLQPHGRPDLRRCRRFVDALPCSSSIRLRLRKRRSLTATARSDRAIASARSRAKTIGLLLQRENREYEHEGQIKTTYQMNIITPFHQVTGQNAKEVLNNLEAKAVEAKFEKPEGQGSTEPVTPSAPVAHPYDDAPLDDNPF